MGEIPSESESGRGAHIALPQADPRLSPRTRGASRALSTLYTIRFSRLMPWDSGDVVADFESGRRACGPQSGSPTTSATGRGHRGRHEAGAQTIPTSGLTELGSTALPQLRSLTRS